MHLVLLLVAGLVLATSSKFAAAVSTVSGNSIGCESPPAKRGHGYRDGRCDGCECCPLRWTCLEMHSCGYNCAERTGIPVEELTLDLSSPSWTVGQVVAASTTGIRWSAIPECHSVLPPGLSLHLNTTGDTTATSALSVGGVLEYDPARPAVYTFHFEALAPLGDSYSEQYSLQRVVGKVIVHNARLASDNESEAVLERRIIALTAGDAKARGAGLAGFRAFEEYYHEHRLSHEDSVRRMYTAEHELTSVLDDFPAASSGLYWNWAGGLYMNLHKLLEDVLVDGCEHHFEQALLYNPEDENLEANLNGCMVTPQRAPRRACHCWLLPCIFLTFVKVFNSFCAKYLCRASESWKAQSSCGWMRCTWSRQPMQAKRAYYAAEACCSMPLPSRKAGVGVLTMVIYNSRWHLSTCVCGPSAAQIRELKMPTRAQSHGGGNCWTRQSEHWRCVNRAMAAKGLLLSGYVRSSCSWTLSVQLEMTRVPNRMCLRRWTGTTWVAIWMVELTCGKSALPRTLRPLPRLWPLDGRRCCQHLLVGGLREGCPSVQNEPTMSLVVLCCTQAGVEGRRFGGGTGRMISTACIRAPGKSICDLEPNPNIKVALIASADQNVDCQVAYRRKRRPLSLSISGTFNVPSTS